MMHGMNRRQFLSRSLAAAPVVALAAAGAAAAAPGKVPAVCLFSKPLQSMDYKTLAGACKAAGLDGVDLTVRPGGHVEPDRVDTDLPAAVDAMRAEGLEVTMITTKYTDVGGPNVSGVLARAAALGIPFVRVGSHQYDERGAIAPQVGKFTEEMRALAAAAEKAGITLGYHNHSGGTNFGGPVWDLCQALEAVNSPRLGSNLDLGHATVEGAFSMWEINTRRIAPLVKMVAVKDFVWKGNKPEWVPLGEGRVDTARGLALVREFGGFTGPVSIHIEYKTKNTDAVVEDTRKAAVLVRGYLAKAGYAA
jgi:sugar phosphate isomerase/epimerase